MAQLQHTVCVMVFSSSPLCPRHETGPEQDSAETGEVWGRVIMHVSRTHRYFLNPPKSVVLLIQKERDLAAEIARLLRNSQI